MAGMLITVVETVAFVARAKGRMNDEERRQAIDMIAADPESGRLIEGGGGLRKIRFGIGGRGKRGGVRIIYYLHNLSVPVFLLSVFAKNERRSDEGGIESARQVGQADRPNLRS